MKYAEYIVSGSWHRRRRRYLASLSSLACEACGGERLLQVHHRNYERLGAEPDADLVALCQACHEGVHTLHRTRHSLSLEEATDLVLTSPTSPVVPVQDVAVGRRPSDIDSASRITRLRQASQAGAKPWEGFGSKKGIAATRRYQWAEAERTVSRLLRKASKGGAAALTYAEHRILNQFVRTLKQGKS